MKTARPDDPVAPWAVHAILVAVTSCLFAIRLTGAENLFDNEDRLGAYVLDILQGGSWICPHDSLGNTDKPPLLAWLATLAALPSGRVTPFALYLPSALATLATAAILYAVGRRWFGARSGLLGALSYLLCDAAARQVATARWDGLFALTVTLAAVAAFRAWVEGASWTWFWLLAAVSTLTKGPVGVVLAGAGLLAVPWERRTGRARPLIGSHRAGILLFLLIVFGWFALALRVAGRHLVDDMIFGELVGHAVEHAPFRHFYVPPGDYLAMAAPWSVFACIGLVRLVVRPAADDATRSLERFLFCWFFAGLLLFSVVPHTAARLLYPILPPAALLAGRELARWTAALSDRRLVATAAAAVVVAALAFGYRYHHHLQKDDMVQRTAAIRALARQIESAVGDGVSLTFVDTPFPLQLVLDVMRPAASFAQAASLLGADAAAFVVVEDFDRLRRVVGPGVRLYELARSDWKGVPYLRLVGNRPHLDRAAPVAVFDGPIRVTVDGLRPARISERELILRVAKGGTARMVNEANTARTLRVRFLDDGKRGSRERVLAPGETWVVAPE